MTNSSNGSGSSAQNPCTDKYLPAHSSPYSPFAGKTFETRNIVFWIDPTTLSSSQTRTQSVPDQQL
ncbi:hypothetical protein sscle_14g098130 [Sclerotinia sclerotiorum 1980 UF-70]|uniref:Uncharacterized protein n=1 Tax=Sclerotinia sclerotiorum (strain ATCC 18683 / 1980 / Ss-1) TaxID=665079 RepID=A0A1D9QKA8_SCLS1|nr:hypothetical protein sscle_14g098130 [Sclerotinia sclerotiorum 1980 UF-70]